MQNIAKKGQAPQSEAKPLSKLDEFQLWWNEFILGIKTNCIAFRYYAYDSKKGTVFGRNGMLWLRVGVFYLIFYTILFSILIGMIFIAKDYFTNASDVPNYYGDGSILSDRPHLKMIAPSYNRRSVAISYDANKQTDFEKYLTEMRQIFNKKYNHTDANKTNDAKRWMDCTGKTFSQLYDRSKFTERSCHPQNIMEPLTDFGNCIDPSGTHKSLKSVPELNFGFPNQPCVAIGFSKILGWVPAEMRNQTTADDFCSNITVNFTCAPKSNNTVGYEINIYPENGISSCHFPYARKLDDYAEPFVFVQLDLTNSFHNGTIEVTLRCRAPLNLGDANTDKEKSIDLSFTITNINTTKSVTTGPSHPRVSDLTLSTEFQNETG